MPSNFETIHGMKSSLNVPDFFWPRGFTGRLTSRRKRFARCESGISNRWRHNAFFFRSTFIIVDFLFAHISREPKKQHSSVTHSGRGGNCIRDDDSRIVYSSHTCESRTTSWIFSPTDRGGFSSSTRLTFHLPTEKKTLLCSPVCFSIEMVACNPHCGADCVFCSLWSRTLFFPFLSNLSGSSKIDSSSVLAPFDFAVFAAGTVTHLD